MDNKTLASGSHDKTVHVWDISGDKPVGTTITGFVSEVNSVAFAHDNKTLACVSGDKTIALFNIVRKLSNGKHVMCVDSYMYQENTHDKAVTCVAFSPVTNTLASGSEDNTVKLWNVSDGKFQNVWEYPVNLKSSVRSVALSFDSKTLVTGSDDNTISVCKLVVYEVW